jgi:hypothetical protein
LFAKESAFAVPLFYLAIVWLQRTWSMRDVLNRLRLLTGISVLYLLLRQVIGPPWPSVVSWTRWVTFMTHAFPQILVSYAKLVLVPLLLYPNRVVPPTQAHWILFAILFCALTVWLWTRAERWPLFCLLWIVIAFLPPTLVMVSKSLLHDHWAYPALLGFLLPIAILFDRGLHHSKGAFRKMAKLGIALVLITWTALVQWHISLRKTDASFFNWSARFSSQRINF